MANFYDVFPEEYKNVNFKTMAETNPRQLIAMWGLAKPFYDEYMADKTIKGQAAAAEAKTYLGASEAQRSEKMFGATPEDTAQRRVQELAEQTAAIKERGATATKMQQETISFGAKQQQETERIRADKALQQEKELITFKQLLEEQKLKTAADIEVDRVTRITNIVNAANPETPLKLAQTEAGLDALKGMATGKPTPLQIAVFNSMYGKGDTKAEKVVNDYIEQANEGWTAQGMTPEQKAKALGKLLFDMDPKAQISQLAQAQDIENSKDARAMMANERLRTAGETIMTSYNTRASKPGVNLDDLRKEMKFQINALMPTIVNDYVYIIDFEPTDTGNLRISVAYWKAVKHTSVWKDALRDPNIKVKTKPSEDLIAILKEHMNIIQKEVDTMKAKGVTSLIGESTLADMKTYLEVNK